MAYNESGVVIGWCAGATFTVSHYGNATEESFVARSGIRVWRNA